MGLPVSPPDVGKWPLVYGRKLLNVILMNSKQRFVSFFFVRGLLPKQI